MCMGARPSRERETRSFSTLGAEAAQGHGTAADPAMSGDKRRTRGSWIMLSLTFPKAVLRLIEISQGLASPSQHFYGESSVCSIRPKLKAHGTQLQLSVLALEQLFHSAGQRAHPVKKRRIWRSSMSRPPSRHWIPACVGVIRQRWLSLRPDSVLAPSRTASLSLARVRALFLAIPNSRADPCPECEFCQVSSHSRSTKAKHEAEKRADRPRAISRGLTTNRRPSLVELQYSPTLQSLRGRKHLPEQSNAIVRRTSYVAHTPYCWR